MAASNRLRIHITKPDRLATPAYGQVPGSVSHEVFYYDPVTNEELARVHQFIGPTGEIGASGSPDPLRMTIGGVKYRLHKGPDVNRDPSLQFRTSWARTAYKQSRKLICCRLFGSAPPCAASRAVAQLLKKF